MSRYRKIDTRIMYDEKFRDLSDDGKLVFMMLLVHPNMTALGGMRASIAALAEDLDWSSERFRKGLEEPLRKGMVRYDERGRMIALPNFLRYNAPENPNVVKAWGGSVDLLPECDLKTEVIQWAYKSLSDRPKSFAEGFAKALGKPSSNGLSNGMPNQEPEPEPQHKPDSPALEIREGTYTHAHTRGDELPYDAPTTIEEGRRWLEAMGLPESFLTRLMHEKLYPSDIGRGRAQ